MAEGKLTAHFGHCQEFALIDADDKQIIGKEMLVPPPHEPGVLPGWLRDGIEFEPEREDATRERDADLATAESIEPPVVEGPPR